MALAAKYYSDYLSKRSKDEEYFSETFRIMTPTGAVDVDSLDDYNDLFHSKLSGHYETWFAPTAVSNGIREYVEQTVDMHTTLIKKTGADSGTVVIDNHELVPYPDVPYDWRLIMLFMFAVPFLTALWFIFVRFI